MRRLLLLLPLALALSCYTTLNHPLIRQESRLFTPANDSDCRSCHVGEAWLADLEGDGWSRPWPAEADRWHSFRSGAWWSGDAGTSSAPPAFAGPAPANEEAPPPAPPPQVMGSVTSGARHVGLSADTSGTRPDPPPGTKDRPGPRRPRQPAVDPVQPAAPADSARKGS
ncbi:MAG: hypothetical protein Q8O14_04425 [bacterium]|jgi:hypothetical protein|nr:hypothetical protein [bacterium]